MAGTGQFNEVYVVAATLTTPTGTSVGIPLQLTRLGGLAGRIDQLIAVNLDASPHTLTIERGPVGSVVPLFSVSIPSGSGSGTPGPVDVIAAALPSSQPYLLFQPGDDLWVAWDVNPSVTGLLRVLAAGGTL